MELWGGGSFFLVGETHFDFDFVVDVFVCHFFFPPSLFLFFWQRGVRGGEDMDVMGCGV